MSDTPPRAWKCSVCGYVHRESGPPEFCPVCGAPTEEFKPHEDPIPPAQSESAGERVCMICGYVQRGVVAPDLCPVCGAASDHFEAHAETGISVTASDEIREILIAGAGIAGLSALESFSAAAPSARITLVSKEERLPYYRLNLTRFLAGEVREDQLPIHPPRWYEDRRVRFLPGVEVASIDPATRRVKLSDGATEHYDRLILAIGSHPFIPPIPGSLKKGVSVMRTLDDAHRILEAGLSGARCVCVGGGILGLETAGALRRRGAHVTLLEGHEWLMPRQLSRHAGRLLEDHVNRFGVRLRTHVRVEAIEGEERVSAVRLEGGDLIEADYVVIAAGVRPNTHLARQVGLEVNLGVVVNHHLRTSDPAIFAAGDVAEHRGVVYGIWPASQFQGSIAGLNAIGQNVEFGGIPPSNTLKVLGIDLVSTGEIEPRDGSYRIVEQDDDGIYYRFVFRDNHLRGAILMGDTRMTAQVKEAIERQADFSGLLATHPTADDVVNDLANRIF